MKSKFIKSRDSLPKEFSIKKYRALNSLDIDGWYSVVSSRFHLNRRIRSSDLQLKKGSPFEIEAIALLEEPVALNLLPVHEDNFIDFIPSPGVEFCEYGIRPISFFNAFSFGVDKKRFGSEIDAFERYLKVEDFSPEDRRLLQQPICSRDFMLLEGRSPDVTVEVSLAMPDEILIKDFKSWLKAIRKKLNVIETEGQGKQSNEVSDVTLGWVKTQMAIPYIDLSLWASSIGLRLSPELFVDVLGMNDVKSLESTKKWVDWVLKPRTIDALFGECSSKIT